MIKSDNKRITITLPDSLISRLEYLCNSRGISKTSYMRECLEQRLERDIDNLDRSRAHYEVVTYKGLANYKVFGIKYGQPREYIASFCNSDLAMNFIESYDGDFDLYGYESHGVSWFYVEVSPNLDDYEMAWKTEGGYVYIKRISEDNKMCLADILRL